MMKATLVPFILLALPGCYIKTLVKSLQEQTLSAPSISSVCEDNSLSQSFKDIGSGTVDDPYILCTSAQLWSLSKDSAGWTQNYELGTDLDLANYDGHDYQSTISPLGIYDYVTTGNSIPFSGSFNGKNYKIFNLKLTSLPNQGGGFFGYTFSAKISNLNLESVNITATRYGGALVAYNKSTAVENVHVSGQVNGTDWYIGGLIGFNDGSGAGKAAPVSNSTSSVNITGDTCIGGFIGWNTGISGGNADVTNSSSTGTVTSPAGNTVAGFISYNIADSGGSAKISRSFSTGSVTSLTGGSFSAGFVGTNKANGTGTDVTISDSYSTSSLNFPANLNAGFAGGFVGHTTSTTGGKSQIVRSYYSGNIHITAGNDNRGYIGGLVGYTHTSGATSNSDIYDSYATGSIQVDSSGGNNLGGLIGQISRASATVTISRTYAAVNITGTSLATSIGGWNGTHAGDGQPTISSSFWNTDLQASGSGIGTTGITGLNTTQMHGYSSFPIWDFNSVWSINEGLEYPRLRAN